MDDDWPKDQAINGLTLRCICPACPESYDVFKGDSQVAYFRLRHGKFSVEVPDVRGMMIYSAVPKGDGVFAADERQGHLEGAVMAVLTHLKGNS